MSLTSFSFLVFFGLLLIFYYILPKKTQWILLLFASILFYCLAGSLFYFCFLASSILTTYAGALLLGGEWEKQKAWRSTKAKNSLSREEIALQTKTFEKKRTIVFSFCLFFNLGILFVLKYSKLLVRTGAGILSLFGLNLSIELPSLFLPLAISFYTFQILGYLINVYRGAYEPQKNLGKYALFACFFPQMVSGPISRYNELSETLYAPKSFDYTQVTFGLQRMAWGFFKKLVISERMAVIVNTVYGDYTTYRGTYIIVATIAFAFQLYTDFGGCMDIAIGAAQALGIRVTENFETPYFSKNISEYWRRWHITLGTWLKDYVFYPLLKTDAFVSLQDKCKKKFGKKQGKKLSTYIGMFILWFTVGLWHGGAWKYIVGSGLLHWFYIVSGQVTEPFFKKIIERFRINTECFSFSLFQILRTFTLVCIGFVFFRADSFKVACKMLFYSLIPNFGILLDGSLFTLGLDVKDFGAGIIALLILFIVSLMHQKGSVRAKIAEQNIAFRWMLYYGLLFAVIIFGFYGAEYSASDFIYQQF